MREIPAVQITQSVFRMCIGANYHLPADVCARIDSARNEETFPAAKDTLDKLSENARIAGEGKFPICQDTGMALVFVEIGEDAHIVGNLEDAVNEGVRRGYQEGYLRKSVVADPLRRVNTGDNTPAMLYVELVPGDKVAITVAPKGFGSENMSRIAMLMPSDGAEGVKDFVVETVELAGPNPCPPIVVGVGLGGTFDKAALLSKKALLRPLGQRNPDPYYAELEEELLDRINALGIGPQGFGGKTTALGVNIECLPTHIAGLPCAVNINCHVSRHLTEVL
ncbi:MAG: fumarate hydratase [Bacillota bacterium]